MAEPAACARERRLRSMLKHERQTAAMGLAAALHQSRDGKRGVGGRSQSVRKRAFRVTVSVAVPG